MKPSHLPAIGRHFALAKWRAAMLRGGSLTHYQDSRARQQVAYAVAHAPFYRAHWAGHDLADWRSLPPVDKHLMMEQFDHFNTRAIRRDEAMHVALAAERSRDFAPTLQGLTVGLSSGTSGHRGLFLASEEEEAAWAGVILARTLHRVEGRLRVAFFLRSNSNLYESVGGALIQFRYFDLMTPLAEAVARLNLLRPHIVVAPPSLLAFLADAREAGALRIGPERLISVAEVLEPQERVRLEAAFQAPVHQIYQCTEGLLAVSCTRGALHIQEDLVAVQLEPLDAGTQATAAGEAGEDGARFSPIVTDLWRRTQPILRYRLNDVLRLDPHPCICGCAFRVIAQIEGRCDDVCYFLQHDGVRRPFFPDTIRRMVLLAGPALLDYAAVQERDGHLRIHLHAAAGTATDELVQAIHKSVATTLRMYGCRPAKLDVELTMPAPAAGAKRRRVRRVAPDTLDSQTSYAAVSTVTKGLKDE